MSVFVTSSLLSSLMNLWDSKLHQLEFCQLIPFIMLSRTFLRQQIWQGYVRSWACSISPILLLFWKLIKVNSKFRWRHTHTDFWKLKIILISEVKEDIQSLDFSWKHVANWLVQRRHSLSPSTTILWFCNFTSSHLLPRWMETQIHRVKLQ